MNSLFSIFDPSTIGGLGVNWVITLLLLMLIPGHYWIMPSHLKTSLSGGFSGLYLELKTLITSYSPKSMLSLSSAAFFLVLMNNTMGLAPYVFTSTSHLSMTMSVAVPMWVGHMVYSALNTPILVLAHLTPSGSPGPLAPFMVVIETLSSSIRPITLSVRLAANMVAGHLLMELVGSSAPLGGQVWLFLALAALLALALLEMAVALIQAYVFSTLTVLYVNEVSSVAQLKSTTN